MIPFLVHADLASGVATSAPWGTSLDGLLASQLWDGICDDHQRKGLPAPGCRTNPDPPDLDLPLARCGDDTNWHWLATTAYPIGHDPSRPPEQRLWTSHHDQTSWAVIAKTLPTHLSERHSRWRGRAMPTLVTNATALTWTGVGDPDRVHHLLAPISWIGRKRHTGEGRALRWTVTPRPDLDPHTAGHLHPNGTLGRPVPDTCVAEDITDGGYGPAGVRPPYQHPSRQRQLRLPTSLDRL